jgi:ribosomal protein L37E
MKNLMLKCRNLEKEGCHPKVVGYKKRMDKTRIDHREQQEDNWSFSDVVRDLDEICRQCESHFFWIEKKVCPICDSRQFKDVKGFEFYKDDIKIREDSFVECRKCGTLSRLIKWLS